MSSSGISDDLAEYVYSNAADEALLETLELRHPAFVDDDGNNIAARVVNSREDFTGKLEDDAPMNPHSFVTFKACGFEVKMPESQSGALPRADFEIANVTRILAPYLDLAVDSDVPIELTIRTFLASRPDTPQHIVTGLTGKTANAGGLRVKFSAGFEDFLSAAFGKLIYTTQEHPSLGY